MTDRGEFPRPFSRRRVISGVTLAGGAAAVSSLAAACGKGSTGASLTEAAAPSAAEAAASAVASAPSAAPAASTDTAARKKYLVDVFETNFGEQMRAQPKAWTGKFRKMSAGAFPFYRGSAVVYYTDLAGEAADPFVTKESSRVWIQGDLHADNFGTYLDSDGRLIFNVNDFDEAYVGPYTWDVRRLAASMALIGYDKSFSDGQIRQFYASRMRLPPRVSASLQPDNACIRYCSKAPIRLSTTTSSSRLRYRGPRRSQLRRKTRPLGTTSRMRGSDPPYHGGPCRRRSSTLGWATPN